MSLVTTFYKSLFRDAANLFPEFEKRLMFDLSYLQKRLDSEGDNFALFSLPLLGKALETTLITLKPFVSPCGFQLATNTVYPKFLSCFFEQLLTPEGSPLYSHRANCQGFRDAASSLYVLRQILLSWSKCKDAECMESEEATIASFEKRITSPVVCSLSGKQISEIRKLISSITHDDEGRLHPSLAQWDSDPYGRHGPGVVAGREKGKCKWSFQSIKGCDPLLYKWNRTSFIDERPAQPHARVISVPKDFRRRRIICIEPKELQFAQQGLMEILYDLCETSESTRKSITFKTQAKSQKLSNVPGYSTIDLKDASDRVSLKLCRLVFRDDFFRLVTRYRSRGLLFPNGKIVKPTCFASMGSALCFPIETIVFWAIARAATDFVQVAGSVRVFGDDIIVPTEAYDEVIKWLVASGAVINEAKSCHMTPIREACGTWYFGDYDCRFEKIYHRTPASAESWLSLAKAGVRLSSNGFPLTGRAILHSCNEHSTWKVPYGHMGIPPYESCGKSIVRLNSNIQSYEVKMPTPFLGRGRGSLTDDQALYAWIVGNDTRPSSLGTVKVEMRWTDARSLLTELP